MRALKRLIAVGLSVLVLSGTPLSGTAQSELGPGRWAKTIEQFSQWDAKNSAAQNAVLFVGSSSIVFWPTAASFPEHTIVNRGFGGSQIADVNHYFDQVVTPYAPAKIVLYAGDNDIAFGKSAEQVFADFKAFTELVRSKVGQAEILFLAIKPSLARWELWPQMRDANALISAYTADRPGMDYVDVATPLLGEDGTPGPFFVEDGLHLNANGYLVWTQVLAEFLK